MNKKVKGKYNKAIIFTSVVEEKSIEQIKTICDMEIFKHSKIRVMPDVHAGAGCTIGTTMTLKNAVVPNMVGVDIGCGMETIALEEKEIDFEKLDNLIREKIPYGREIRKKTHPFARGINVHDLRCGNKINKLEKASLAIGSLGGGNHFIEIDKDDEGNLYLVIHSGSRHLGKQVAEYYQERAYKRLKQIDREGVEKVVAELKAQCKQKEIENILKELKNNDGPISKDLAYCTGDLFDDYIHDMGIMQKYADLNRKAMADEIISGMNLHVKESFTTIHNYIDIENMILRKGAVSAKRNEKLLIPINMKDGSLICIGKGNRRWNKSAPHGAGRLYSRSDAFKQFNIEEFKKQMEGIYSTTVNEHTIDESPMAYKNMKDIVDNIGPTAKIIEVIKPIYNFKADN